MRCPGRRQNGRRQNRFRHHGRCRTGRPRAARRPRRGPGSRGCPRSGSRWSGRLRPNGYRTSRHQSDQPGRDGRSHQGGLNSRRRRDHSCARDGRRRPRGPPSHRALAGVPCHVRNRRPPGRPGLSHHGLSRRDKSYHDKSCRGLSRPGPRCPGPGAHRVLRPGLRSRRARIRRPGCKAADRRTTSCRLACPGSRHGTDAAPARNRRHGRHRAFPIHRTSPNHPACPNHRGGRGGRDGRNYPDGRSRRACRSRLADRTLQLGWHRTSPMTRACQSRPDAWRRRHVPCSGHPAGRKNCLAARPRRGPSYPRSQIRRKSRRQLAVRRHRRAGRRYLRHDQGDSPMSRCPRARAPVPPSGTPPSWILRRDRGRSFDDPVLSITRVPGRTY